ncbi:MAG: hypothetical protein GX751_10640 [Desulfuromonadaceae bacterium]|nr:hypothetical protein [Desulfuromonadaceae bacterium]
MCPFSIALFFPLIIGIAIVLGFFLFYIRRQARIRQSFEELSRRVHGTISRKSMFRGDLLEGRHDGSPYSCRYRMGSKNRPPSLRIRLHIPGPVKLVIRRKSWYDRFAAGIGLAAELPTGDAVFDQAFNLDTEQDAEVLSSLADQGLRRQIEALFGLGFPLQQIVFAREDLSLVLSPFRNKNLASVPLEKYLELLKGLSGGFSSAGHSTSCYQQCFAMDRRPPVARIGLALLFVFCGFLVVGGVLALVFGLAAYKPVGNRLMVDALILSAPVAGLFLMVVFLWLRGRSSAQRFFSWVLLLSLTGFPLSLTGGAVVTNGLWDRGDEVSRRVRVTGLYYRTNKNSRRYYLVFPSWQAAGRDETISVPFAFFRSVRRGEDIVVRTKPGYWREEWLTGFHRATDGDTRGDLSNILPLRFQSLRFYGGGNSAGHWSPGSYPVAVFADKHFFGEGAFTIH